MTSANLRNVGAIEITTATVTLTVDAHSGVPLLMNRAAGITATLPAATGTGAMFEFIGMADASGNQIIQVASASDTMMGVAKTDMSGVLFATADTTDTITLNGTTTGGYKGWRVLARDVASGVWWVDVTSEASGTEATPFSAAVS